MVAPAIIGAGISAAGSLLGGLFGQSSQEKMAEQNIKLQREFAQKGIQWKAADALKAGIHPLYAMGAQTHSFAPVSVGDSLGPAMASASQDIGSAVARGMTGPERVSSFNKAVQGLTLDKMALENQLLSSQIARLSGPGGAGVALPDDRVAMEDPFGVLQAIGPGAPAQAVENEYGDISAIEGGYRYLRDRVPGYIGTGGGMSAPWISIDTPWTEKFEW